ncbi:hypothetical protein D050_4771B, partial [Vibrio parahaemolyticus VPCR-2009]
GNHGMSITFSIMFISMT